mmetsp:Transcript_29654/g.71773  ORF Transcript_29654/g.71773 Transcript_29654/m.71773 type:complete len:154 (-) Transcript_29654:1513-1974(-)
MAPVEELPHTVHWFLDQVTMQHYDGTSFYRNAPHILMAGPEPNSITTPPGVNLYDRFIHSSFPGPMFQEYSENFPHREWTLGLAGRPATPYFYINMQDNTELHGPGGQGDHHADPCFARVVDGFETVQRMQRGPHDNTNLHEKVAIVSMRIAQ